jgi:hypothetical protein
VDIKLNVARSVLDLNDVVELLVDLLFEFGDEGFAEFGDEEGGLHVFPGDVEVLWHDGHAFVQLLHVGPLVVVGPAEDVRQEEHHGGVQFGDVGHVHQEELVDALVVQHELVELRHHLLQLVVPAQLFEQRH